MCVGEIDGKKEGRRDPVGWKMKRTGFVCALLVLSMMMGFAQGTKEMASPSSAAGEIVDITVMVYERGKELGNGCSTTDNLNTRWMNGQLAKEGVHVTYVPVARSGSDNTVNSLLAAGDAPDVIMTYDRERVSTYGKQGGLVDLKPYVSLLAPEYLEKASGKAFDYCTFDGKMFAIPRVYGLSQRGHNQYIRKDLCDAMGIAVPSNRKELIDYLYLVKKNYPDMIPYAFSGKVTDGKYTNFVLSYTSEKNERDNYIYDPTFTNVLKPGSKEGFKQLNRFVLDGIIPKDFAVDTDETKYKQSLANGNVGFILDGNAKPAYPAFGKGSFMLVSCDALENADGDHVVPSGSPLANYVYVPKSAEKKIDAVMKYLHFMSVKENSINIHYDIVGEGSTLGKNGVPVLNASNSEMQKKGYSADPSDLDMLYTSLNFGEEASLDQKCAGSPNVPREFFKSEYETNSNPKGYYHPVKIGSALPSDQYVPLLQSLICEFAFKVISAPEGQFDKVWNESYQKLLENHLQDVLDERAAWYDKNKK
jgi:putative aldouronate transport system substrate-binding protein